MVNLAQEKCTACRPDSPRVTPEEMQDLLPQVPGWQVVEREGIPRLERVYRFRDFASSLEFATRVGRAAEEEGHHPQIIVEWGRCTVAWWTHKIKGLHRNDFIMAAKTDRLYQEAPGRPERA